MKTKFQILDEQVKPLMEKIVAICEQHKISYLASFEYDGGQVISVQATKDCNTSDLHHEALSVLRNQGLAGALAEQIIKAVEAAEPITEPVIMRRAAPDIN